MCFITSFSAHTSLDELRDKQGKSGTSIPGSPNITQEQKWASNRACLEGFLDSSILVPHGKIFQNPSSGAPAGGGARAAGSRLFQDIWRHNTAEVPKGRLHMGEDIS